MKKDEKVILESILKDCGFAKEIIASCLQIKEKYGEQEILPVLQQERYRHFTCFAARTIPPFAKNSWRTTKT